MTEPTNQLSATLRRLRKDAGLSGVEAARKAGLSQPKISRTETGRFMPTPDQVAALCRAYKAPAKVRRDLVAMAREVREERISARVVLERGGWWLQERIGRIEAIAGLIRCLSPTMIPGLLQTRDYTQALFGDALTDENRERTIDARMVRQRLLDSTRQFEFVLSEGALRWNMGGATVMINQLNRLIEESRRPNVRLGLVAWTTPVTVPVLHSVDLYDSRAVMFGTQTATALITEPHEVEEYENHWTEVSAFVTWDEEARSIITKTISDYQEIA